MKLNIDALEASFDQVAARGDELVESFYERLFTVAPAVRPLFAGTDLKYEALPEHYSVVGEVLIASMAEIAGEAWSVEYELAWTEAFAVISGAMLDGASSVASVA